MNRDYQVINGDCIEVLRNMTDNSVDVVITDPPYNVGLDYENTNDSKPLIEYEDWCSSWFAELERITKSSILITTGQVNLSKWSKIKEPDWWLAWWKPAAMGRCVVGFNNWEPIAVYKRGKIAKRSCDVIRAPIDTKDKTQSEHPCPKPIEWALKQIEIFSFKGDIILDPFCGSGTTGIAAVKSGRKFIGIDHSQKYCDLSVKRIEMHNQDIL